MTNKKVLQYLFIILVLATLLRFYHIDTFSLWYDEADSIFRSEKFFEYIPIYITYKDGEFNNISSNIFSLYGDNGLAVAPPFYF